MANRYRVVRVLGGVESRVQDFAVAANASANTEQSQRAAALALAKTTAQAGSHVRVYSPNPATGDQSSSDRVWDSELHL